MKYLDIVDEGTRGMLFMRNIRKFKGQVRIRVLRRVRDAVWRQVQETGVVQVRDQIEEELE